MIEVTQFIYIFFFFLAIEQLAEADMWSGNRHTVVVKTTEWCSGQYNDGRVASAETPSRQCRDNRRRPQDRK